MPLPLIVNQITKRFVAGMGLCQATVQALQRASLIVRPAEVVGVIGPPGSGKSTLLLCAAGLLRPDAGTIWWFERYHDADSCADLVRFVSSMQPTAPAIEQAVEDGAKLIVLDDPAYERPRTERLDGALGRARDAGVSILLSARGRSVAPLCSRVVELVSGRTDAAADLPQRRLPARVAEDAPSLVDPPFGWV